MFSNLTGSFIGSSGVDWPWFYASALSTIWRMRNEWVFNQTPFSSQRIWSLMKSLGMEQKASSQTLHLSPTIQGDQPGIFYCRAFRRTFSSWVKPYSRWVKANVNSAVRSTLGASCGCVLHNSEGRWLKVFGRKGSLASANAVLS